jgi:hypothetical protein
MSITLTGTGGLFTRQGKIFQAFESANVYIGDSAISSGSPDIDALGTSWSEIIAQFASNEQDLVATLTAQRDSVRAGLTAYKSYLVQLAQDALVEQVHRDVTLTPKTLDAALRELIKQMVGAGALAALTADNDVDASTVSATCAAATTMVGANTGNATLVGSVKRTDSRDNELVLAEVVDVICDSDEQTDGSGRAESWTVIGEPSIDTLDFRWPDGSGASTTLTTVDPSRDNAGGNLLTNSDFETFTSNIPDNWNLLVGTAGTTILAETSNIYGTHGSRSLRIKGDSGGTLTAIYQAFDSTTGTTGTLSANTVYHGNCYVKDSGAGLLAGVITFSLTDGSGTVLTNDAGSNLSTTLAYSTTTTTMAAFNFTFVTPKAMPTNGVRFKIAVTTALTDGESIYIDDLALAEATEIYTGGPHLTMFAGSTNPIIGDKYTATIANNYAGEIMQYFDRFFGMRELGLQLPSDTGSSETIADTLIG